MNPSVSFPPAGRDPPPPPLPPAPRDHLPLQSLTSTRKRAGAATLKHGRAQDGRGPVQQHAVLVRWGPPRPLLPDAGAEGGLRLRAAALHLPGPAHRALLPDPAGPLPQHALVQLDRPHREGHL